MTAPAWIEIVGAGVSSVMLALHLSKQGRLPGPVVISDSRQTLTRSQSFGFWLKDKHPLDPIISERWPAWGFSLPKGPSTIQYGHEYQYALVEGERFFQWVENELKGHPDIHIKLNTRLTEPPKAKYVFDSRPPEPSQFISCQSFVGFEVQEPHRAAALGENTAEAQKTNQSKAPRVAQLMSSLQVIDQSLVFLYELPCSTGRTLIEWTAFGARPFDLNILEQLGRQSAGGRTIVRQEQGVIPMGLRPSTDNWGIPIGARGNMTRAASGYGFLRMWDWAQATAQRLVADDRPSPSRADLLKQSIIDPDWLRWMDRCLLRLINEAPDQLPHIFMQLGTRLPADDFARFMMQPTVYSASRMIMAAPKRPFIFSALGQTRWI